MEKENWESIGDVSARLMARLEEEQRRLFENLCRQDGVGRRKSEKTKEGVGHE